MRNKMWALSAVVTVTLGIVTSEAAASVITGDPAADLFWEQEWNYGARKTVRGRMENMENLTQGTRASLEMATGTSGPSLSCPTWWILSSLQREVGKT